MEKKDWKRNFAFRLKEDDEIISRFICSSKKSESDTIRELLRFAINEINRVRDKRILAENFRQLESKLTELIQTQEKNHHEIMEFLKNNRIISDNEQNESNKDNTNSSMENSIDSVIDMFNADTFLK